jgi:hypothetical protein
MASGFAFGLSACILTALQWCSFLFLYESSPTKWPAVALEALEHLTLAMPSEGIAPLAALRSLTLLRLKHALPARPTTVPPPRHPGTCVLAAWASIGLHYATMAPSRICSSGGSLPPPIASARTVGTALLAAAAPPLVAAATRALYSAAAAALAPPFEAPAGTGPSLAPLAAMAQLEWLELRGSDAVEPCEWAPALAQLRRVRRLDVRGTSFSDGDARVLAGWRRLRVLLAQDSAVRSAASLRQAGGLGSDVRVQA